MAAADPSQPVSPSCLIEPLQQLLCGRKRSTPCEEREEEGGRGTVVLSLPCAKRRRQRERRPRREPHCGIKRGLADASVPESKRLCVDDPRLRADQLAPEAAGEHDRSLAVVPRPLALHDVSMADVARGDGVAMLAISFDGRVLRCNSPETFATLARAAAVSLPGLNGRAGAILPVRGGLERGVALVEEVAASRNQRVEFDSELPCEGKGARYAPVAARAFVEPGGQYVVCIVHARE